MKKTQCQRCEKVYVDHSYTEIPLHIALHMVYLDPGHLYLIDTTYTHFQSLPDLYTKNIYPFFHVSPISHINLFKVLRVHCVHGFTCFKQR